MQLAAEASTLAGIERAILRLIAYADSMHDLTEEERRGVRRRLATVLGMTRVEAERNDEKLAEVFKTTESVGTA